MVVDKAERGRDKCCGDGLTKAALMELAAMGFDPGEAPSWQQIRSVELVGPRLWGTREVVSRGELGGTGVVAVVVRRQELDAVLGNLAERAGAEVRYGAKVTGARVDDDGVRVELDGGEVILADWVVGADGARGVVGATVRGRQWKGGAEWLAMRQYRQGVELGDTLRVEFARELLPAYAWVFPLGDGAVNVGFGVHANSGWSGGQVGAWWKTRGWVGEDAGRVLAWPIPVGMSTGELTCGRLLLVGDAGGLADGLSGEGIAQALTSGRLAGEAIVGGRDVYGVGAAYCRTVSDAIGGERRVGDVLMRVLARRQMAWLGVRSVGMQPWVGSVLLRAMMAEFERVDLCKPWVTTRPARGAEFAGGAEPGE
jgi:geranylgeranyl reductase family protein